MEIINISKKNEVYIKIDSEASTAQEICDHFTFMVPGYTFMPAYRNRMWDGKIRLLMFVIVFFMEDCLNIFVNFFILETTK